MNSTQKLKKTIQQSNYLVLGEYRSEKETLNKGIKNLLLVPLLLLSESCNLILFFHEGINNDEDEIPEVNLLKLDSRRKKSTGRFFQTFVKYQEIIDEKVVIGKRLRSLYQTIVCQLNNAVMRNYKFSKHKKDSFTIYIVGYIYAVRLEMLTNIPTIYAGVLLESQELQELIISTRNKILIFEPELSTQSNINSKIKPY